MSIFITGMKMPKSGYVDVRIFHDNRATTATAERPFYKEMVVAEVPTPHGRLIDADALVKKQPIPELGAPRWLIEQAPTIIPAEPTQSNASNVLGALTNADRIRSMTDEDLAHMFSEIADCADCIFNATPDCTTNDLSCQKRWLDWLKQEAEG